MTTHAPSSKKRGLSPLLAIFLIVAVDILGLTIVLPLLPFYAEKYGASPVVVGMLVTLFALCQLLSGPVLGALSDRIGRKPLLLISQFGTFIGFLILAFANSLWMIFLSRIIDGATAGNLSLAQAAISDVTPPKDRAKAFGIIGIAFGLGFLIGPAISGFLAGYGYHYPILAAAGLSLLSILATAFLLPDTRAIAEEHARAAGHAPEHAGPAAPGGKRLGLFQWGQYKKYFGRAQIGVPLLLACFFFMGFSLFMSGFALFAERRFTWDGRPFGPREVGYVYAYVGLLGIFIQGGLVGRLVKRFGEEKVALAGFITAASGSVLLALNISLNQLLMISVLTSFGTGVLRPALTSLISQRTDRREQGVVLGLMQSLNSVAQILAPLLGGLLIEHSMLSAWALAIGLFYAGGILLHRRLVATKTHAAVAG